MEYSMQLIFYIKNKYNVFNKRRKKEKQYFEKY